MPELDEALRLMLAYPDLSHFVGHQSEDRVPHAEGILGFVFPPTFRRYVLALGAGSFGGEEFYGVIRSDFTHSTVPDAVWLTLKLRAESSLPTEMILIYSNGYGDYYRLDLSRRPADGEAPVVVWDEGYAVVPPDFGTFLLEGVRAVQAAEQGDS